MRKPHHGRGGSRHVGRLRIAAAEILNKALPEVHFEPDDIVPATGRCRSDWRQDIYRWEVFARYKPPLTIAWAGQSWQTLTEFVRNARNGGKVTIDKDCEISCYPATNDETE